MKQDVNLAMFKQAFHDFNRENNFSYEGLEHLYDYLIDIESDTGEEIELDVIALCCDYREDSLTQAMENYGYTTMEEFEDKIYVIAMYNDKVLYVPS